MVDGRQTTVIGIVLNSGLTPFQMSSKEMIRGNPVKILRAKVEI